MSAATTRCILFSGDVDVPAPLRAVIRHCLEPEPEDRYQSAGELAADLRAIADDFPLCHAREPIFSRLNRRVRRNRRRLAGAAIILLAGAAVLGAYLNYQFERYERFEEVRGLYQTACAAIDEGEFERAQILLDNAAQRASHSELGTFRHLLKWETFWGFGGKLRRKLDQLWMNPGLEDLEDRHPNQSLDVQEHRHRPGTGRQPAGTVRGSPVPADRPG